MRKRILLVPLWAILFTLLVPVSNVTGQSGQKRGPRRAVQAEATEREVAARFAPVFYQVLGNSPRGDYITNFDFDGDWIGNNNWKNTDDKKFTMRGFVYYSVSETRTHYFIHYAVFHARDYKGGETTGVMLSEVMHQGIKKAMNGDPTGLLAELTAAHENDLEGALVVAERSGLAPDESKLVYVETLHHNIFKPYAAPAAKQLITTPAVYAEGEHPLLFVEPKGHGIEAYDPDSKQTTAREFIIYKYSGKAGDPEKREGTLVGYDLLPISSTLWPRTRPVEKNETYGIFTDYGDLTIDVLQPDGSTAAKKVPVGKLASAFLGSTGGINMARPPWGWFSLDEPNEPLGLWFFDPAKIVKRHYKLSNTFSTTYVRLPFWAVN